METYIETYTGKKYHFLDPKPEEICIEDIAYSLANKCRFSGHTHFFSVAEHSCTVAARLPPEWQLAGLLHDAVEAYLGDIPSPLKAVLPDYRELEQLNEKVVASVFGIDINDDVCKAVKEADVKALYTEAHFLIPSGGKEWSLFKDKDMTVEYEFAPLCMPPALAYEGFMRFYKALTEGSQIILTT